MGNVASMAGWGFQIAEHASSKTWLFGLQARKSRWGSSFEAECSRREVNRERRSGKIEMRKTQRLDYTGDGGEKPTCD